MTDEKLVVYGLVAAAFYVVQAWFFLELGQYLGRAKAMIRAAEINREVFEAGIGKTTAPQERGMT